MPFNERTFLNSNLQNTYNKHQQLNIFQQILIPLKVIKKVFNGVVMHFLCIKMTFSSEFLSRLKLKFYSRQLKKFEKHIF